MKQKFEYLMLASVTIVLLMLGFVIFFCTIAKAEEGITTTITDDAEDWNVAEYSLPINNQHQEVVDLKTEYTEIKNHLEQKSETQISPTGYSVLVTDNMVEQTNPKGVLQDQWITIQCQKLQEKINNFHRISEFDKIHIQHEQTFKNWR